MGLTTPSEGDINVEKYKMQFRTELTVETSSGIHLKATPGKTTTVLGSFKGDTEEILCELGNVKTMYFGSRDGYFNLLNTPDNLYDKDHPEIFWEAYNKPWLDEAIARGDIIMLATEPVGHAIYIYDDNGLISGLTGYGREIKYLESHGYVYDRAAHQMVRK